MTLELYAHARDHAAERGIIIADTKFEFGVLAGRRGGARRRGPDPGLVALLARRRLRAGPLAGLVRQAVRARLARRVGLGPLAPRARAARGRGREHARPSTSRLTSGSRAARSDVAGPYADRMNLFVCGLRRSGTTILYDALGEDPELRCFYEPLREDSETIGGGSGARDDRRVRRDARAARALSRRALPRAARSSSSTGAGRGRRSWSSSRSCPTHVRELLADLLGLRLPTSRSRRRGFTTSSARSPSSTPTRRSSTWSATRARSPPRCCSGAAGAPTSTPTPTPSSPPAPGGACGRAGGSPRS